VIARKGYSLFNPMGLLLNGWYSAFIVPHLVLGLLLVPDRPVLLLHTAEPAIKAWHPTI
jgi:hypothetical protein